MKRVWITGGGSGIGKALALSFSNDGAKVIVSGRDPAKLDDVQRLSENIQALPCDITDVASVNRCVAKLGPVDTVVLNAGDYTPGPTSQTSISAFRQTMEINYFGTLNCIKAVLPHLQEHGGRLAIVASLAGYIGLPNASGYGPSKAALISLCESLRAELQDSAVTIQVINPGFVKSELTAKNTFQMPFLMEPKDAAQAIRQGLQTEQFEIAFPGPFVRRMKMLQSMPYWAFFKLMKKVKNV